MIGQTISHYRIVEKLGEGGMGVVYKAQDTKLDRLVALKFLPSHLSVSDRDKARFVQEARAASALNHPNILTIYDFYEEGKEEFIVMELVEGESLKAKIHAEKEAKTQLSTSQVVDYGFQIAQGLAKAHEKGIVHRDIKCENIMATKDGLIKIMDFGLAKLKGAVGLTRTGSTVGTIAYMSPEQVRGEEVDEQSDIWAYGVVLFELLAGQLPFRGEHESAMMYSITNENAKPLTELRPDLNRELRQIVERCLEKDRSKRYASMSQILEDISKLKPTAVVEVMPLSLTVVANVLKRPAFAVPVVLVLLALVYLTYWYVNRNANIRLAREEVLPSIDRLVGESKWASAYFLARQVEDYVVDDPLFVKLRPQYAARGIIRTEPSGAEVSIAEYGVSTENWVSLGLTPTDTIFLPSRGLWRLKLQKKGFNTFDGAAFVGLVNRKSIKLDPIGSVPEHMDRVPGGKYVLNIPGLDHLDSVQVGDFLIDRFEVTNKEFKEFVDQGGYQKKEYWKHPFDKNGRTLTWEDAMKEFVDATGRIGPATWELGTYPDEKENYPVGGISWYEAAAYAEFRGKSLPTVYHWNIAAETRFSSFIIPPSNFDNKGPAPVG
ncbi:MAG: protein kinase domain-containing protein, partial [Bacteroidota bacterium]